MSKVYPNDAAEPSGGSCSASGCGCSLRTLVFSLVPAGWLALYTAVEVAELTTELRDPRISAPALILAFILFEARDASLPRLCPSCCHPRGGSSQKLRQRVSLAMLHVVAAWYAALRINFAPSARVGVEIAHALLVYVALLLLLALRAGSPLAGRVGELEVELAESRVQYEAVCTLLQRRGMEEDSLSESEGDEREHLIVPPKAMVITTHAKGKPQLVLPVALAGKAFDRPTAVKIAQRIRKKNYSVAMFYEDVRLAFPELSMYLATIEQIEGDEAAKPDVTSGLGGDDEYRRTIGALFAVYWLMRIGLDGERGFSFGVDDAWKPHEVPSEEAIAEMSKAGRTSLLMPAGELTQPAKRRDFYEKQDWARLQQLLVDSGMLQADPNEALGVSVNVERTVAMLSLTAFHDVMKVQALLPVVAAEHAPYLGFKSGDIINDHDIALGYVLDFYSECLPSFVALTQEDQKTIRFTQSKMSFNHGWLVQGEAPPSPLFAKFKEVMLSEGVAPPDVAFYFVHWLTDLAGAEPSPLGGAEKFVLKFPHAVLDSFIRSFSVLNELAVASETEVMEKYLVRTWGELPHMPAAPTDEDGVALMRLALQAQTPDKQTAVLNAWRALPREDAAVLREEMARTGISGQKFAAAPKFSASEGPAFLVYYSPAFLRTMSPQHSLEALRLLAEVYRRARSLWPLGRSEGNAHSVTIRIDQIKELKLAEIVAAFTQGESWLLCRKNDNEAVVERQSLDYMTQQAQMGTQASVLKFYRLDKNSADSRGTTVSKVVVRLELAQPRALHAPANLTRVSSTLTVSKALSRKSKRSSKEGAHSKDGASACSGEMSPVSSSGIDGPIPAAELQKRLSTIGQAGSTPRGMSNE